MQPQKAVKSAAKLLFDEIEEFEPKKFLDEASRELNFFSSPRLGAKHQEIAKSELSRARQEQKLQGQNAEDKNNSEEKAHQIQEVLAQYREVRVTGSRQQTEYKKDMAELTDEVVKLAKASGIDTKVHLKNSPKVGKMDISFLTFIIKTLRVRAEESKSAKDMVGERANAKRTTGMLAWVSGKQSKIYEQGTMTLQG